MDTPKPIGVGLLGLGVVGCGVAQALQSNSETLSRSIGAPLKLHKVLVRDLGKPRSVSLPNHLLTLDVNQIFDDPAIQIVVELIGGENPASGYIKEALEHGKHLVTANKEVMAKEGHELMVLADSQRLNLLFEGTVGGGIPIIGPLMRDLLANRIFSIHAIINGTTNFILSRMADEGMHADEALKLAQELGYAEADPSDDIDGKDAAYKLAILATLAFHSNIQPHDVYREGITRLDAKDFKYARELGWAIKLLAIAKCAENNIEVRVHPALIPEAHLLAKVRDVYNAAEVEGDLLGRTVFHGLGAGRGPTTSAVLGDLVEIGRGITAHRAPARMAWLEEGLVFKAMSDLETKYYLRLNVSDRVGVLAQITRVLGDLSISIASIIQKDADPKTQTAEIVITTHPAREASIQESLTLLDQLEVVAEVNSLIRIEELPS